MEIAEEIIRKARSGRDSDIVISLCGELTEYDEEEPGKPVDDVVYTKVEVHNGSEWTPFEPVGKSEIKIQMPPIFENAEICGYCARKPNEPHKNWCRQ